ncbi:MAG: hypothetical protein SGILL_008457 [Bacillariaceae sp.]
MAGEEIPPSARFEFPRMLYGMLEECTFDDNYNKIVSWQDHGLSFKIHDREGFERILPNWFKEKYESFRCLLEQWGFIKLSRGKERGCWYQVNFVHGRKAQYKNIEKEAFLKGMPEYLSPRDEPDLAKLASLESMIADKRQRLKSLREPKGGDSLASLPSKTSTSGNKRSRADDDSTVDSKGSVLPPLPKKVQRTTTKPIATAPTRPPPPPIVQHDGGGCTVCGRDDDHSNLLLCEGCETETHTYCLDPPLDAVPEDDWFCERCSGRIAKNRKELTKIIKTIPEHMRSRFGEVCFSKNSSSSSWWPAMIFDPRSFLQNVQVVDLCKRNLGKKNLVFYFENQEAFAAVPDAWIVTWEEGVKKEYDKGKPVRSASKQRQEQYQAGLEAARLAMLGSADADSKHSESTQESCPSPPEATPASPLKEVDDDTVQCSKCGKTMEVSEGPVLQDGYWHCLDCSKVPAPAPPKPTPAPSTVRARPSRPIALPTKTTGTTEAKSLADQNWNVARKHALANVASHRDQKIDFDDEILKGVTQRPSGKWQAQVYYAGKSRYIGVFPDRKDAALAFKLVRAKLRPHRGDNFYVRDQYARPAAKSAPTNVAGALKDSFNTIFGNSVSQQQMAKRISSFTDKKPDSKEANTAAVKKAPFAHRLAGTAKVKNIPTTKTATSPATAATPRYIDDERTKILLETSLCRYYSDISILDL